MPGPQASVGRENKLPYKSNITIRYFRDQPVTSKDITDAHLIVWHFEDWLKKYFFTILQLLEVLSPI